MKVTTVFQCHNLCLKLQKGDKGEGTRRIRRRKCDATISMFCKLQIFFAAN